MVEVLTKDEEAQILYYALKKSPRDYTILATLCWTGLRVGELASLIFDDLLIGGHMKTSLMVRAEVSKSGRTREIPMGKRLRDILQDYLNWLEKKIGSIKPEYPIFQQLDRIRPISTRQIERIIKKMSKESIGKAIHPHILRHTFATNLMRVTDIRIVQEILGHTNLASTQIYTHPNNCDLQKAVDRMDSSEPNHREETRAPCI